MADFSRAQDWTILPTGDSPLFFVFVFVFFLRLCRKTFIDSDLFGQESWMFASFAVYGTRLGLGLVSVYKKRKNLAFIQPSRSQALSVIYTSR